MLTFRPDLDIKVDGAWLRSYGSWGDLSYKQGWPGGCLDASWQMTRQYGSRLNLLRRGQLAEVCWGGLPIWTGPIEEPQWNGNTVAVKAVGLFREGQNYDAFDASSNAIDIPSTAITQAITRGLRWRLGSGVPTTALVSGTTEPLNNIHELMEAHAEKAGQKWMVGADRYVTMFADPTVPVYQIPAGIVDVGVAGGTHVSHVILRYVHTDGSYKSAWHPEKNATPNVYENRYGHVEWHKDITDLQAMSTADAESLAEKVYTGSRQRPGWSNGFHLLWGQLLNRGGRPVHPAAVRGARMVRAHGVPDEITGATYTDLVIGETSYKHGEPAVTVNPVGMVANNPEAVWQELYETARAA